jgi:hypothetical protein
MTGEDLDHPIDVVGCESCGLHWTDCRCRAQPERRTCCPRSAAALDLERAMRELRQRFEADFGLIASRYRELIGIDKRGRHRCRCCARNDQT